jgi:hypothetical protein
MRSDHPVYATMPAHDVGSRRRFGHLLGIRQFKPDA